MWEVIRDVGDAVWNVCDLIFNVGAVVLNVWDHIYNIGDVIWNVGEEIFNVWDLIFKPGERVLRGVCSLKPMASSSTDSVCLGATVCPKRSRMKAPGSQFAIDGQARRDGAL